MLQTLINKLRRLFGSSEEPSSMFLFDVLGFSPKDESYYRHALKHRSVALNLENNERLEFLGDSILESVVSDYLYEHQPEWTEGKLSSKRSEWVSRTTNNSVAEKLGLLQYIEYNRTNVYSRDMLGNALEALIGAIFLDYGYEQVYQFFVKQMLPIIQGLEQKLGSLHNNYKSQLLELSQKERFVYEYKVIFAPKHGRGTFRTAVAVGKTNEELKPISEGFGRNKKEAEQEAARLALQQLKAS